MLFDRLNDLWLRMISILLPLVVIDLVNHLNWNDLQAQLCVAWIYIGELQHKVWTHNNPRALTNFKKRF